MPSTRDIYSLRIQVGRFLCGRDLAVAVFMREVLLGLLSGGMSGLLAPAWVVVTNRHTGQEEFRVGAGREANAAPDLLAHMEQDAEVLSLVEFIAKWKS